MGLGGDSPTDGKGASGTAAVGEVGIPTGTGLKDIVGVRSEDFKGGGKEKGPTGKGKDGKEKGNKGNKGKGKSPNPSSSSRSQPQSQRQPAPQSGSPVVDLFREIAHCNNTRPVEEALAGTGIWEAILDTVPTNPETYSFPQKKVVKCVNCKPQSKQQSESGSKEDKDPDPVPSHFTVWRGVSEDLWKEMKPPEMRAYESYFEGTGDRVGGKGTGPVSARVRGILGEYKGRRDITGKAATCAANYA